MKCTTDGLPSHQTRSLTVKLKNGEKIEFNDETSVDGCRAALPVYYYFGKDWFEVRIPKLGTQRFFINNEVRELRFSVRNL